MHTESVCCFLGLHCDFELLQVLRKRAALQKPCAELKETEETQAKELLKQDHLNQN